MSETKLTIDRASRGSREKEVRRRPWTPPSRLDAPPAPEGFQHRWIRAEVNGFDDRQNVYGRKSATNQQTTAFRACCCPCYPEFRNQ